MSETSSSVVPTLYAEYNIFAGSLEQPRKLTVILFFEWLGIDLCYRLFDIQYLIANQKTRTIGLDKTNRIESSPALF